MTDVAAPVRELYAVVEKLEALFPGRHFTPDGPLVGSLGKVVAAQAFDLELMTASNEGYHAAARAGRRVEIKATQVNGVSLQSHGDVPNHLLVLAVDPSSGSTEIAYNGPAGPSGSGPASRRRTASIASASLRFGD